MVGFGGLALTVFGGGRRGNCCFPWKWCSSIQIPCSWSLGSVLWSGMRHCSSLFPSLSSMNHCKLHAVPSANSLKPPKPREQHRLGCFTEVWLSVPRAWHGLRIPKMVKVVTTPEAARCLWKGFNAPQELDALLSWGGVGNAWVQDDAGIETPWRVYEQLQTKSWKMELRMNKEYSDWKNKKSGLFYHTDNCLASSAGVEGT